MESKGRNVILRGCDCKCVLSVVNQRGEGQPKDIPDCIHTVGVNESLLRQHSGLIQGILSGEEEECREQGGDDGERMDDDNKAQGRVINVDLPTDTLTWIRILMQSTGKKAEEVECDFFRERTPKELMCLACAFDYLQCDHLLNVVAYNVALRMASWSRDQCRREFGIVNDLTPEEEETIEQENAWCRLEGE